LPRKSRRWRPPRLEMRLATTTMRRQGHFLSPGQPVEMDSGSRLPHPPPAHGLTCGHLPCSSVVWLTGGLQRPTPAAVLIEGVGSGRR
jgi:hypothetical protein